MKFKYLEKDKNHPLIAHFFELKIEEEDIPFESVVLPMGLTSMTYIYGVNQFIIRQNNKIPLINLTVSGQFYGGYSLVTDTVGNSIGFGLRPTSLYKILKTDISKITNKHLAIKELNLELHHKLSPLFLKHKSNIPALIKSIYKVFDGLICAEDKNLPNLDKAIDYIFEKEGLLKVQDLLKRVPFSQKSLENQFKKVIGLTPGKYIRQYRFMKLMRKYESKEIDLKDLIYMFNYYDPSHFSKDFKLFMLQTPNAYFKKEYPLLKSYLKE